MKRLNKITGLLATVLIMIFVLCACGESSGGYRKTLETIDKNLAFDFEFLQNVDNETFYGYRSVEDSITMGYVPDGYWQSYLTGGDYIMYSVSSYPNYTSEKKYVTMIYCSDKSKDFFGCTLNSSASDIKKAFEKAGFEAEIVSGKNGATKVTADLGNGIVMGVYLGVEKKYFSIAAKISENSHIVIDWR